MAQPQSELLSRGCKSYVDALTAIESFEREVESICRAAYEHHKEALERAMGLRNPECRSFRNTDFLADRELELGARWPAQREYYFYVFLYWSEVEPEVQEVRATLCLEVNSKVLREEILERIRARNPRHRITNWGAPGNLILYQLLGSIEPTTVSEAFDALMSEWIGYCESIGGLKLNSRS